MKMEVRISWLTERVSIDQVDRHCTKLDNDLQKFEDEQLIGPGRRPTVATSSAAVTAAATRPSAASTTASTSAMVTTRGRTMQQKEYGNESDLTVYNVSTNLRIM